MQLPLDNTLQPHPLKQPLETHQAGTSSQGQSNATIRGPLDPTVPALGAAKAQKAETAAHSGPSHVKSTVKSEFLAYKRDPESIKVALDSSQRPGPNGDISKRVAATVLEKMIEKTENSAHNGSQPGNKPVKLKNHLIFCYKEPHNYKNS